MLRFRDGFVGCMKRGNVAAAWIRSTSRRSSRARADNAAVASQSGANALRARASHYRDGRLPPPPVAGGEHAGYTARGLSLHPVPRMLQPVAGGSLRGAGCDKEDQRPPDGGMHRVTQMTDLTLFGHGFP